VALKRAIADEMRRCWRKYLNKKQLHFRWIELKRWWRAVCSRMAL